MDKISWTHNTDLILIRKRLSSPTVFLNHSLKSAPVSSSKRRFTIKLFIDVHIGFFFLIIE